MSGEFDELLTDTAKGAPPTVDLNAPILYSTGRAPTTMNTRAPTNIHTRLSFDNGASRHSETGQDEGDIPMGGLTRRAALTTPEWMISSVSSDSHSRNKQEEFIGDMSVAQRSRSIPPQIETVPSVTRLGSIDREGLSASEDEDDFRNIVKPIRGGSINPRTAPALADFNSRWNSSQQDVNGLASHPSNGQSVALAAHNLRAESANQREEQALAYHSPTSIGNSQSKLAVLSSLASRARDSVTSMVTSQKSEEDIEKDELMKMSQHQRIRAEALKMLQLADLSDVSSPVHSPPDTSAPQDFSSYGSKTHSLYRTSSGGYSSSYGGGGVSDSSVSSTGSSRNASSFVGLGPDTNRTTSNKELFDKRFSIQEDAEDDVKVVMIEEEEQSTFRKSYSDYDKEIKRGPDENGSNRDRSPVKASILSSDNSTSSWSKRYSENRLFMALNSGMSPHQVQDRIEQDRYNSTYKNTSATNMFKANPHDLEESSFIGSKFPNEDYSYWFQTRRAPLRSIASFFLNVATRVQLSVVNFANSSSKSSSTVKSSHGTPQPTSWNRNINLVDQHHDLPTIPFSPKYDDDLERQQKRRRFYKISLLLILIAVIFAVAISLASHGKSSPKNAGALLAETNVDLDVTFYVTSNTPFSNADTNLLQRQLSSLDAVGKKAASFLVHLGSLSTNCSSQSFSYASNLLKKSPIPVFVVPGDDDWSNCPNPIIALDTWRSSFLNFDIKNKFQTGILPSEKMSQISRPENFSFLLYGILFIGLDIVSNSTSPTLILENTQWIEMSLSSAVYSKSEYRAVVLLGHAPISSSKGSFFFSILDTLSGLNKPVLYIHANDGSGSWQRYIPFPEIPKFEAVMLQYGGSARPVKVVASRGNINIFNFYR